MPEKDLRKDIHPIDFDVNPINNPEIFVCNSNLLEIAQKINTQTLDWRVIISNIINTPTLHTAIIRCDYNKYITDNFLAETHVQQIIRQSSGGSIYPGLPMQRSHETTNFDFKRENSYWKATNKRTSALVTYGQLAIVKGRKFEPDSLAIFAIKITPDIIDSQDAVMVTRDRDIKRISAPLRELCEEHPELPQQLSYAVITGFDGLANNPEAVDSFTARGGLYISLPINQDSFHKKGELVREALMAQHERNLQNERILDNRRANRETTLEINFHTD